MDVVDAGKKDKFDNPTFAVMDGKKNIHVAIQVLVYAPGDEGYGDLERFFKTGAIPTEPAVPLTGAWCMIQPLNTGLGEGDDDDDD